MNTLFITGITVLIGLVITSCISANIIVDAYLFLIEDDFSAIPDGMKNLKIRYYNHKYNLPNKLNQLENIENQYIVAKHRICVMIDTITEAITYYKLTYENEDFAEVIYSLRKIHNNLEYSLADLTMNPLTYSTDDLDEIYSHIKNFCEYMSNEWYLNELRAMDEIMINLEITCFPHFITLSKYIRIVISIDKSGDLLQLMKKEVPQEVVAA